MPLAAFLDAWRGYDQDDRRAYQANNGKLLRRLQDVFIRTWDLGFTAFGGPPVHFRILHQRFVEGRGKTPWLDEQTYQELFAVCQALPGPASTKMTFCIALIHAGFLPALFVFAMWCLPGAIGMYALSLGIQRIGEQLPDIVYALLSGLNASTVGIIALAAVQLAEKAIKDPLTRIILILSGCAGLCYNALWYFPLLMVIGGTSTVVWDLFLRRKIGKMRAKLQRRQENPQRAEEESHELPSVPLPDTRSTERVQKQGLTARNSRASATTPAENDSESNNEGRRESRTPSMDTRSHAIPVKVGIAIIVGFFASFIAILVARGVVDNPPLELNLFASMYLAGTIIFGGGPVVIPLLREYVVEPGWVLPRNFLIGLAIIQAFPGPNFNFAVYLGALALAGTSQPTILGAILGFIGIFFPGIALAVGFQSIWGAVRTKAFVISLLRGVNAAAVGLVFTAVYRLWEIGYLSSTASRGQSLGKEPFWLVVAALTYAENAWFRVPPAAAIIFGGILGLCWYGAVGR
ncbi:chromate ion transporter [Thermoascus aurantiacus ATCC 26904]